MSGLCACAGRVHPLFAFDFETDMPRISKARLRKRKASARGLQVRMKQKAEALNDPNWVDGEQTAGPPSSNAAEAPIVLDDTEGDSEETLSDIEEVAEPSLAEQVTGLRKKR